MPDPANGPPFISVTMERVGRTHDVPPFVVPNDDDVAEHIYQHVRRHLASRNVEVIVSETGDVTLYAGMHIGGRGRWTDA
jgi:hypothetical protein